MLPGPEEFIRKSADELREGRNLVILLPEHFPRGLADAIRNERFVVGDADCWTTLYVAGADGPGPARQVADSFLPSAPPSRVSASQLAHNEELSGRVIWLENLTSDVWPAWCDFLAEYANDCRSRPLLDRTVFIAPVKGEATRKPPQTDVALALCRWTDVIEPIDQLLYASGLLRQRRIPRLQRDLAASVIAALALWDPAVSDEMNCLPLRDLMTPSAWLRAISVKRGWLKLPEDPAERWIQGMSDRFAGKEQIHSAMLLNCSDEDALHRRMWAAQIGVLLPYVESQRRELLDRYNGELMPPFHFANGLVIEDVSELEIGQLEYQLRVQKRVVPRSVSVLKQIRNRLSHLEAISGDMLLDQDLYATD